MGGEWAIKLFADPSCDCSDRAPRASLARDRASFLSFLSKCESLQKDTTYVSCTGLWLAVALHQKTTVVVFKAKTGSVRVRTRCCRTHQCDEGRADADAGGGNQSGFPSPSSPFPRMRTISFIWRLRNTQNKSKHTQNIWTSSGVIKMYMDLKRNNATNLQTLGKTWEPWLWGMW